MIILILKKTMASLLSLGLILSWALPTMTLSSTIVTGPGDQRLEVTSTLSGSPLPSSTSSPQAVVLPPASVGDINFEIVDNDVVETTPPAEDPVAEPAGVVPVPVQAVEEFVTNGESIQLNVTEGFEAKPDVSVPAGIQLSVDDRPDFHNPVTQGAGTLLTVDLGKTATTPSEHTSDVQDDPPSTPEAYVEREYLPESAYLNREEIQKTLEEIQLLSHNIKASDLRIQQAPACSRVEGASNESTFCSEGKMAELNKLMEQCFLQNEYLQHNAYLDGSLANKRFGYDKAREETIARQAQILSKNFSDFRMHTQGDHLALPKGRNEYNSSLDENLNLRAAAEHALRNGSGNRFASKDNKKPSASELYDHCEGQAQLASSGAETSAFLTAAQGQRELSTMTVNPKKKGFHMSKCQNLYKDFKENLRQERIEIAQQVPFSQRNHVQRDALNFESGLNGVTANHQGRTNYLLQSSDISREIYDSCKKKIKSKSIWGKIFKGLLIAGVAFGIGYGIKKVFFDKKKSKSKVAKEMEQIRTDIVKPRIDGVIERPSSAGDSTSYVDPAPENPPPAGIEPAPELGTPPPPPPPPAPPTIEPPVVDPPPPPAPPAVIDWEQIPTDTIDR